MLKFGKLLALALFVAEALVPGPVAEAVLFDKLIITHNDQNVVNWTAANENEESFHTSFLIQNLDANTATIYLTEKKTEPDYNTSIIKSRPVYHRHSAGY